MARQTVPLNPACLTEKQVGIALETVIMNLKALDRVSTMLQCDVLDDQRDVDAMHTLTQSVLNSSAFIVETVARGVDQNAGIGGNDPMEWFMPPLFFRDKDDAANSGAI